MNCKTCGNELVGDGYTTVIRCTNINAMTLAEIEEFAEPDSGPWYCEPEGRFKTCEDDDYVADFKPTVVPPTPNFD